MKNVLGFAVLPALILMTSHASAQSTQWDGLYLGASLGGENSKVCSTAPLKGLNTDPTTGPLAAAVAVAWWGVCNLVTTFRSNDWCWDWARIWSFRKRRIMLRHYPSWERRRRPARILLRAKRAQEISRSLAGGSVTEVT